MCNAEELFDKVKNFYLGKGRDHTDAERIPAAVIRKQQRYLD